MRFLKNMLLISSAAVLLVPFFSCGKHENYKEDSEIEQELEKKYGMDFTLVSDKDERYRTDDDQYVYFKDDKGVEFRVECHREFNIVADSKVEYSDTYIRNYLEKYGSDLISELKSDGMKAEIDEDKNIGFYIDSYYDIDELYEKLMERKPLLIPPEDTYISSKSEAILYHSGDDVSIGGLRFGKAVMQENYVRSVRDGSINEKLPEEIMRKYPAKILQIFINGRQFNSKEYGGAKAYVQEATGEVCIEFKGVYANSQNYIQEYTDLEKFINAVVGNDVKKVYDPNVVYENKDGSQVLKKKAENYFEWTGGKFDLYDDEAVDINSSVLRLYEKDIKRIFGAEVSSDPVFTGKIEIIK